MALVTDCGRMFTYLHDKAVARAFLDPDAERGVVAFDYDDGEARALGLTRDEARATLQHLYETELIHKPSKKQEDDWLRNHPGAHGEIVVLEPCDELTTAAMLLSQL